MTSQRPSFGTCITFVRVLRTESTTGPCTTLKKRVYRAGVQRKGVPDIIGIIDGRFIGIEVKIGADRQSADQKEIEKEIGEAGGVYFIAKSYDDYLEKIAKI